MIEFCSAKPKLVWLGRMILALSHMGVRIGELITLHWRDVDLQSNVIRIQDERASRRKTTAGTARTTKGRRSRTIPIHPELKKLLFTMERNPHGRVFDAALGGAIRENNSLKIFKEQVLRPLSSRFPTAKGEIGFEHGTFHGFRHYFCSQCFLGGASEGEIRSWLGHAESKMVEHYRHLRNEDALRKMEQINFLGNHQQSDQPGEVG